MIEELTKKLQKEREEKRKVVSIFDKRIKNLEKAINSINSYNNQANELDEALGNVYIDTIGECLDETE